MLKRLITFSIITSIAINSHAGFLDSLNKGLSGVNQVLGTVTGNPTTSSTNSVLKYPSLARPTDAQIQKIANVLQVSTTDVAINTAINQAKPNIAKLLLIASCETGMKLELGNLLSPTSADYWTTSVMRAMTSHSKNQCVTVQNIGGWEMPTKNRLKFRVAYSSEISGETVTKSAEMLDEYGNGNWLVRNHL